MAANPSANDGSSVDIISALTYDVCRPSDAEEREERGAGAGRQLEGCRISSSGGMTGSRYSSSGGLWAAWRNDELLLVELWLEDESLNDIDAGAGSLDAGAVSLRSKQFSISSYISPAGADCDISSYKFFSSSGQLPFCAELLFWTVGAVGGSGRARLKNLLVRFSLDSLTFSSSVLLSPTPTVNQYMSVL